MGLFPFGRKNKKNRSSAAVGKKHPSTDRTPLKPNRSDSGPILETNVTPTNNRRGNKTAQLQRVRSKEFSSPLGTIEEAPDDETDLIPSSTGTAATTMETPYSEDSLLHSINLVPTRRSDVNGSLELVVGDLPTDESSSMVDVSLTNTADIETDQSKAQSHDEVRKNLFPSEDDGETVPTTTPESTVAVTSLTPIEEDVPFDQNADRAEIELPFDQKADRGEIEEPVIVPASEEQETKDSREEYLTDAIGFNAARQLIEAFNCGADTTQEAKGHTSKARKLNGFDMLFDTMCGAGGASRGKKRPSFSQEIALQFLSDAIKGGIPLLHHQPPPPHPVGENDDWTGRSVKMFIKLGNYRGSHLMQPKLEWSTLGGGWSRRGTSEVTTVTVDLLDILSVMDSSEDVRDDSDEEDMCFFTITTNKGDVYIFEASSVEERDRIVTGMKNVVARLAFHLVSGDEAISSELYSDDFGEISGDLPSLRTPHQAMNEITHAFLDE